MIDGYLNRLRWGREAKVTVSLGHKVSAHGQSPGQTIYIPKEDFVEAVWEQPLHPTLSTEQGPSSFSILVISGAPSKHSAICRIRMWAIDC